MENFYFQVLYIIFCFLYKDFVIIFQVDWLYDYVGCILDFFFFEKMGRVV